MKRIGLLFAIVALAGMDLWAIQVTPTYQMFTVESGKKAKGECEVLNNDGEDLTISLSSKDWFIMPGNEKFIAADWLTFEQKEFPLKQGESKRVQFTVASPKGAQGELVGMISYEMHSEIPSNINKVLSVAIYNAVKGTEKMKGAIRAVMISPSSSTFTVSILLSNKGNVHIRPTGLFEVQNEKSQTVANIFLEQSRPTYPGKEGVYTGQVKDFTIKPGLYKAIITLTDVDRKVEVLKTTQKFEILENNSVELR